MTDQASILRKMMAQQRMQPATECFTCETLAITSGKGGVGKSNVTMNLSIALARSGQKVLILDADIGTANIDVLLNIDPRRNLSHVIDGQASLFEVLQKITENLYLIPGASGTDDLGAMAYDKRGKLREDLEKVEKMFDFLIVDTSAGVNQQVIKCLLGVDRIFLVCNSEPTSLVDAYALCKVLFQHKPDASVEFIANNVRGKEEAREVYDKLSLAVKHFLQKELRYSSHIIHDQGVAFGVVNQKPLMMTEAADGAAADFFNLADTLKHPKGWANGKGVHHLFENLMETP